jgi:intergrase/recombinase
MTGNSFEPITTQEQLDAIIKARLAREREKWEKESGTSDLQAQLAAKDEEIATIKREHCREDARRAVVNVLASNGVTDEGRINRILKHVELDEVEPGEDGQPDRRAIQTQLAAVNRDMPELLTYRVGAGSGGSSKPVFEQEKPLTREEVENMSAEEQNRPGMKERIDRFLSGERS